MMLMIMQDALRKQTRQVRSREVLSGNASDIAMFCFAELYIDVMAAREEVCANRLELVHFY